MTRLYRIVKNIANVNLFTWQVHVLEFCSGAETGALKSQKRVTGQWITADLPWGKKKSVQTQKAAIEFWGKIGYKDYLLLPPNVAR